MTSKPGWQTSENWQTAGAGTGVLGLAYEAMNRDTLTLPQAIVLAAGCLAVAATTVWYTHKRTAAKGGAA